jgi:hypothetical protein
MTAQSTRGVTLKAFWQSAAIFSSSNGPVHNRHHVSGPRQDLLRLGNQALGLIDDVDPAAPSRLGQSNPWSYS